MAFNFYNPLNEIFESTYKPHSRTLRTGFFKKMWDSFFVFSGTFDSPSVDTKEERYNHLGVFDYLLLGIPYFIEQSAKWSREEASFNSFAFAVLPILNGLALGSFIARYSFAAVCSLATSPITFLVSIVAKLVSWSYFNTLEKAHVSGTENLTKSQKGKNVKQLLDYKETKIDGDDLEWHADNEYKILIKFKNDLDDSHRYHTVNDKKVFNAALELGLFVQNEKYVNQGPRHRKSSSENTSESVSLILEESNEMIINAYTTNRHR